MGAGINKHPNHLECWRPPFRLCHQLKHRGVANPEVHHRRIGFKSRPQPIYIAG